MTKQDLMQMRKAKERAERELMAPKMEARRKIEQIKDKADLDDYWHVLARELRA